MKHIAFNKRNQFIALALILSQGLQAQVSAKVAAADQFLAPSQVAVKGLIGESILLSEKGRMHSLPDWKDGQLIKMFTTEQRNQNATTDWYGEHAGKWMYSAALAANRTSDPALKAQLFKTADYLVSNQEKDGYMGSYSPQLRITNKESKLHRRSWDVWSLSCMVMGLLEVDRYFPTPRYRESAMKIGELLLNTFGDGKADLTDYGTRYGYSATIALEPVVELYKTTGDQRYLDFARLIVKEVEQREGLRFISAMLNNRDVETVADGKAYQIIWNVTGLAKLYEITGTPEYLKAIENAWQNIKDYHLTITGGPWGGIGKHKECFNTKGFWDPYGYIETCSTMSWIQLNKQLLHLTGNAKYAQEIERSAYNSLIGAQFANGEDWSYHTFTNGKKHAANYNDCCPSSGMLALQELSPMVYSKRGNGIALNLFTESEASIALDPKNTVKISQTSAYPFDGKIRLQVSSSKKSSFPLFIRIPEWANNAEIRMDGKIVEGTITPGSYFTLNGNWNKVNTVEINFPMELKTVQQSEYAIVPQGTADIYRVNWIALVRGPLVYATNGLINGEDREKNFQLSSNPIQSFTAVKPDNAAAGYQLTANGEKPLLFLPYYEAGGRTPGTWRLTWIQNKID